MADDSHHRVLSRAAFSSAITALLSLALVACAHGESGTGDSASVDVRLDIEVPTWGEWGLASLEFSLPRTVTAVEARNVLLRMRSPSSDKVVAATAAVSADRRQLTVVAVMVRRRGRGPVRRHPVMLEGTATLPGGASAQGGRVRLTNGILFYRNSRRADARGAAPGGAVAAGQPTLSDAGMRCAYLTRPLRRASTPVLLSGQRAVKLPSKRLRNGSPLVSNATPAGLVLDQVIGEACKPPFTSRWLARLAGWSGPPA